MLARVVLAIDNPALRKELRSIIAGADVAVDVFTGKGGLWQRAAGEGADLVVVSRSIIPTPAPDTIRVLRNLPDPPNVVVVSEHEDPEERARFLAAGCDAVVYAGLSTEHLRSVLAVILQRVRDQLERGLDQRRAMAQPRLTDFVSNSPAMQAFMDVARRVVASNVSLLILGETGVGKERLARAIHAEGPRSSGPFVAVNCGALPETLLESELFGHEEGSFTGASRTRRGLFELAHGGTVFLDEVGEMPIHLQVKLLRALQEREIQRVGSEKTIPVDVRVMAASNRHLEVEVQEKRFRRDLYYRLSVVTLTIPPLRERREDVPALVDSYIRYFQAHIPRRFSGVTPDAIEALARYAWPGNVRELINTVERAMLLGNSSMITLQDLPEVVLGKGQAPALSAGAPGERLVPTEWLEKPWNEVRQAVLDKAERSYLAGLLDATGGRIGETARRAGMRARSLYDKMKHHGLRKETFRKPPGGR